MSQSVRYDTESENVQEWSQWLMPATLGYPFLMMRLVMIFCDSGWWTIKQIVGVNELELIGMKAGGLNS